MIWVDREVKKIKERKYKKEWVDDMKTPSGRIHVGALRGVVIHDLLYKVLEENDINVTFSYVFNDMDPMDAIPSYLDYEKWEPFAGKPLFQVPSPEKGFDNYAKYFAQEFIDVFESINCHPQIIWSSKLYTSGKMNEVIKQGLDNANIIRDIYAKIAKAPKPDAWYPFQVICEKCGKIGTTQVTNWDGEKVEYECKEQMVAWAKGCGNKGKISPFNGNGKFLWKVDWPAHWKVIGITVEGSGKDHMSSGGSYDMSSNISKDVFKYEPVYAPAYEWFTIGGRKMSSSKGIGVSAKEVSQILPPEVFRFLIVRTPIGTHLDFNPYGDTILNLFDDYDRCLNAHFDKIENKIPEGKQGEVLLDFARIIELSEVRPLPEKRIFIPRFRTVVNAIKNKTDVLSFFEKQKGDKLTNDEKEILEERTVFAEVYLQNYSQDINQPVKTEPVVSDELTDVQKKFIKDLTTNLKKLKSQERDEIQLAVFDTLKKGGYKPKEVFSVFYQTLIGQNAGPRAADILLDYGFEKALEKLESRVEKDLSKKK